MEFKFYLRNLRIAPRKVRSVAVLIKGLPVISAQNQLSVQLRRPAEPILKLLKSGISSSEKNFNAKSEHLYVKNIFVDEGPMLKRFRPRAHGRAGAIHKKTSHITLILASASAIKVVKSKKKTVSKESQKLPAPESRVKEEPKVVYEAPKILSPKQKNITGMGRRIFRRKAIG